jgi:hypothetical protein
LPEAIVRQIATQVAQVHVLSRLRGEFTITGDAAPELLTAAMVSSGFFPTMGAQPIAGRPILPGDTQPGAKPVPVVSYALWQGSWGGDKSVLGRTIRLNNKSYG